MREYFYRRFPAQLAGLEYQRPNEVLRLQMMRDPAVVFFGGSDWENVRGDLAAIPEEDRARFILSLFMVVVTDQALYTYFKEAYESWRKVTNFPKFGWSGFGPHNENPFKLLWAPEREGTGNHDELISLIPEFVRFWVEETGAFFREHVQGVDMARYFEAICNDEGYAFDRGSVVPRLKAEFEALIVDRG